METLEELKNMSKLELDKLYYELSMRRNVVDTVRDWREEQDEEKRK